MNSEKCTLLERLAMETGRFEDEMRLGILSYQGGRHDYAIEHFLYAEVAAGCVMQSHPEHDIRQEFRRYVRLAQGYRLQAYSMKMMEEPWRRYEIAAAMDDIIRGEPDCSNPRYAEIAHAFLDLRERFEGSQG